MGQAMAEDAAAFFFCFLLRRHSSFTAAFFYERTLIIKSFIGETGDINIPEQLMQQAMIDCRKWIDTVKSFQVSTKVAKDWFNQS